MRPVCDKQTGCEQVIGTGNKTVESAGGDPYSTFGINA
jgi:hypothetical protein